MGRRRHRHSAFQRGSVWSQVQASKLIESFCRSWSVPGGSSTPSAVASGAWLSTGSSASAVSFISWTDSSVRSIQLTTFRLKGLSKDRLTSARRSRSLASPDEGAVRRLKNSVLRAFVVRQLDPGRHEHLPHWNGSTLAARCSTIKKRGTPSRGPLQCSAPRTQLPPQPERSESRSQTRVCETWN